MITTSNYASAFFICHNHSIMKPFITWWQLLLNSVEQDVKYFINFSLFGPQVFVLLYICRSARRMPLSISIYQYESSTPKNGDALCVYICILPNDLINYFPILNFCFFFFSFHCNCKESRTATNLMRLKLKTWQNSSVCKPEKQSSSGHHLRVAFPKIVIMILNYIGHIKSYN